jgi:hypothetical protein
LEPEARGVGPHPRLCGVASSRVVYEPGLIFGTGVS